MASNTPGRGSSPTDINNLIPAPNRIKIAKDDHNNKLAEEEMSFLEQSNPDQLVVLDKVLLKLLEHTQDQHPEALEQTP